MIDLKCMSYDELYNIAEMLDDVHYLSQRYDLDWIDKDTLQAERKAIDESIEAIQAAEQREMRRWLEREELP